MTDYSDRRGDFIITYTGKRFYPLDPRPEDINILDIAHSLSLLNRFTGHTEFPYSVAQHSVAVSYALHHQYQASKYMQLSALMHDASEAYVNDLARPLKRMLPDYTAAEKAILDVIDAKFLVNTRHALVKEVDNRALVTEAAVLCVGEKWYQEPHWEPPFTYPVKEQPWRVVKEQFLQRFRELQ